MDLQHILTRGCWGPFFEDIINIFFQILHLIFTKFLWLNWLKRRSDNGGVKGSNPARAWNFFFHIFLFFATFFKPWAEPRLSFYFSRVIKRIKKKQKKQKKGQKERHKKKTPSFKKNNAFALKLENQSSKSSKNLHFPKIFMFLDKWYKLVHINDRLIITCLISSVVKH